MKALQANKRYIWCYFHSGGLEIDEAFKDSVTKTEKSIQP